MKSKLLKLMVLAAFAVNGIACGSIDLDQVLALAGDENRIDMTLPIGPTQTTYLEGGVDTTISLDISWIDLLFSKSIFGVLSVNDVLFHGTPFSILGTSTGDLCVRLSPTDPGGGTVVIDFAAEQIDFATSIGTNILVTNPALAGLLGGGFDFAIAVESSQPITLIELIGLAFGGGGLEITQTFDETIVANVPPIGDIPIMVSGELTLASAEEFPTSDDLTFCADYIANLP